MVFLILAISLGLEQDTTRVVSRGPGVWKTAKLVEELRFGALEENDPYIFGDVVGMTVGTDGSMFVADMPGRRLRMYDARGKYVKTVGRSAGPGEFRSMDGLETTRDKEISIRSLNVEPVHSVRTAISYPASQLAMRSTFRAVGREYFASNANIRQFGWVERRKPSGTPAPIITQKPCAPAPPHME
jgi:hypothetical protein